jgi:hypothetical protein
MQQRTDTKHQMKPVNKIFQFSFFKFGPFLILIAADVFYSNFGEIL